MTDEATKRRAAPARSVSNSYHCTISQSRNSTTYTRFETPLNRCPSQKYPKKRVGEWPSQIIIVKQALPGDTQHIVEPMRAAHSYDNRNSQTPDWKPPTPSPRHFLTPKQKRVVRLAAVHSLIVNLLPVTLPPPSSPSIPSTLVSVPCSYQHASSRPRASGHSRPSKAPAYSLGPAPALSPPAPQTRRLHHPPRNWDWRLCNRPAGNTCRHPPCTRSTEGPREARPFPPRPALPRSRNRRPPLRRRPPPHRLPEGCL